MSQRPPSTPSKLYKILPSAPPTPLPATLPLSPLDTSSGYIHLSTAAQVPSTAARFFTTSTALWVLELDAHTFADGDVNGRVVWEVAGDDGVFPHLYGGGLGLGVVSQVLEFRRGEDEDWRTVLGGLGS